MRKSLLLVLSLGATTAACTSLLGDFTTGPSDGGASSSTSSGTSSSGAGDGGGCNISAQTPITVYAGQPASLAATSTSPGAQFTWKLTPPDGSTATLQNAQSATPTFTTDIPGAYDLVASVTGSDCSGSSQLVVVNAVTPSVIYARGSTQGGAHAEYVVSAQDGGAASPVVCPDILPSAQGNTIALYAANAGRAYDFWEAPAGQPSEFAAFTLDYPGNAPAAHLWAGTTSSSCDAGSPPADLGTSQFALGAGVQFGAEPSFSPDGKRFAVYDANRNILTYAADGTGMNKVAPYFGPSGTPVFDTPANDGVGQIYPPRVVWLPSSAAVAWARSAGSNGWQVVTATDTEGSVPSVYMNCAGVTPRQIAYMNDGSIIASYRTTPGGAENLYQLLPDSSQNCQKQHQYTNLSSTSTSVATDFSVSPDGKTIAFLSLDPAGQDAGLWTLQGDGGLPGGYVYTVPISGGTPQQVPGTGGALFGPRWIGGGTMLVYTRLDKVFPAGALATSVVTVSPSGSGEQVVAQGDGQSTFVSTSGSGACSTAPGRAAPLGAGALVSLAAAAELLRRRRARRRSG